MDWLTPSTNYRDRFFVRSSRKSGVFGAGRGSQLVWHLAVNLRDSQPLQSKGLELQGREWSPAPSSLF